MGFSFSVDQLLMLLLVLLQHTPRQICMSAPVTAVHRLVLTPLRVSSLAPQPDVVVELYMSCSA